eukprot:gene8078-16576_t
MSAPTKAENADPNQIEAVHSDVSKASASDLTVINQTEIDSPSATNPGVVAEDSNSTDPAKTTRTGGRILPQQWLKDELFERLTKIGRFEYEPKTNKNGDLSVAGKRIFGETWTTLKELIRRYPEIRRISFVSCYLTDVVFEELMEVIRPLDKLRILCLNSNLLTHKSIEMLISTFAMFPQGQKMKTLDLRDNHFLNTDGKLLYAAFPLIVELNGIAIASNKLIDITLPKPKTLAFSSRNIKAFEVTIICCLLSDCPHIQKIDLSRNSINSDGIKIIAQHLRENTAITSVDISHNPVTDSEDGRDLSGAKELLYFLKHSNVVCELSSGGCKIPVDLEHMLQCSVQVNRSVRGLKESGGRYFEDYIEGVATSRNPPPPKDPLEEWTPSLHVDVGFSARVNITHLSEIQTSADSIILLNRKLK